MLTVSLTIPRYSWRVDAYFAVSQYYANEICTRLYQIGVPSHEIADAYAAMSSDTLNSGITHSNLNERHSVLVTKITSSPSEFINSYVHELGHLAEHICTESGISLHSEDLQYLTGDLAQFFFPYVQHLLCPHCRKKAKPHRFRPLRFAPPK